MSFGSNEAGSPIQGCPSVNEPPEPPDSKTHWIIIELVDEATGQPAAGEEYRVTLPDGVPVTGYLDSKGSAYIGGIEQPGACKVTFPRLHEKDWKPA